MVAPQRCPYAHYFNSIKVRLEQKDKIIPHTINADFNSIKVRLEPTPGKMLQGFGMLFQFHKGAIRTFFRS